MSTDTPPPAARGRPALSEDGWRQAARIALGSVAGLSIAKIMDWPFGVFFAVYPILLLGLLPVFNARVAVQFLASSLAAIAAANLLILLGSVSPFAAALAFFLFAAHCFRLMAQGRWFLFGAVTAVSTSVLVHLASHASTPAQDLYAAQFIATALAVFIAATMHALLPERRPTPPPAAAKPASLVRHQMLLGAICATASHAAFQVLDLADSLSAQAATILVLFPMTLAGGRAAAWTRVVGTLLGSAFALVLQVAVHSPAPHLPMLVLLYGAGMLLFATMHVRENAGPAVGFGAATAVAVLAGQLSADADLYGVSLYRSSSIAVASLLMLLCIFATQTALDLFPASRAAPRRRPPSSRR